MQGRAGSTVQAKYDFDFLLGRQTIMNICKNIAEKWKYLSIHVNINVNNCAQYARQRHAAFKWKRRPVSANKDGIVGFSISERPRSRSPQPLASNRASRQLCS